MEKRDLESREVSGLYKIVPLKSLRQTPGVSFDVVPREAFPRIDALDRVLHEAGAVSPGPVGDVARPWYMHSHQDDNLIVMHGTRYIDVYTVAHGKVESFSASPFEIKKGGETVFDGPAMLVWPRGVFHRVRSCQQEGSASLNLAAHYDGFDVRTNFSIYDLDTRTGRHVVIRQGHLDQPGKE